MEEQRQASLCRVELKRGREGEYTWNLESSAMNPPDAVHQAVVMDRLLRRMYYPEETHGDDEVWKWAMELAERTILGAEGEELPVEEPADEGSEERDQ